MQLKSSVTSPNPETAARQLREGGRSRALCPELSEAPGLRTAFSTVPLPCPVQSPSPRCRTATSAERLGGPSSCHLPLLVCW
ncbi:hypothetical protein SRHO_G00276240 [Serrasalmus rhombeus]